MVFPLGRPATWRVIAMGPQIPAPASADGQTRELSLAELQGVVDACAGGGLHLRDPAWLTRFRLHHRLAARYRAGRAFLAGDAAHIHSPAGGQGMNTGIQDAWNLGWKLALVTRGAAAEGLLDSYEAERRPVGQFLLRYTDRLFGVFTRVVASSGLAAWVRRVIVPRVLPLVVGRRRFRALAFRTISQLAIRYRRSPAVEEAQPSPGRGPRAGDRLPDAPIARDGRVTTLQRELSGPCLHLLLCGPTERWDACSVDALRARYGELLMVHHLARQVTRNALQDASGEALRRLGVSGVAQFLVRPDGHVAFRSASTDLEPLSEYLNRWYPRPAVGPVPT
jgi:hypothetical protein